MFNTIIFKNRYGIGRTAIFHRSKSFSTYPTLVFKDIIQIFYHEIGINKSFKTATVQLSNISRPSSILDYCPYFIIHIYYLKKPDNISDIELLRDCYIYNK